MSANLLQNKENRPGMNNARGQYQFLPISPVRDQVKMYSRPDSSSSRKNFNEVERLMDQNKVSRNLSEYWFKNSDKNSSNKSSSSSSSKPYNSYVKKMVKEKLKYDE